MLAPFSGGFMADELDGGDKLLGYPLFPFSRVVCAFVDDSMKCWGLLLLVFSVGMSVPTEPKVVPTGQYLYKGRVDADSVIEHTTIHSFEESTKPRLVEFYSPVSETTRNVLHLSKGSSGEGWVIDT